MIKKPFTGIMPAIFSVYDENLCVKKDTVKKLVDFDLANGVTGFYVGGSTAEAFLLSTDERKQIIYSFTIA